MVIEDNTLLIFKPWLLGYCSCGCGEEMCPWNNKYYLKRFKTKHSLKGMESHAWKSGRRIINKYWVIHIPDYYKADEYGRVYEHVYVYEQYHQCCMLDWGEIHHKDHNKKHNMPWNLEGMTSVKHRKYHKTGNTVRLGKHKDFSDRRCYICKSNKTRIAKPDKMHKTPYVRWFHLPWDKINWYCSTCYNKIISKYKNKKSIKNYNT